MTIALLILHAALALTAVIVSILGVRAQTPVSPPLGALRSRRTFSARL
jgi:hypothetical protein